MRTFRSRAGALAVLLAVGPGACRESKETRPPSANTAAQAPVVQQSSRTLAERREAQPQMDSALASLTRKDTAGAIAMLHSAAGFTRSEAGVARAGTREALVRSANELDTLAARLGRRQPTSRSMFGATYARLQIAEAENHVARAEDAFEARDHQQAGSELLIVVDHLERAAQDGGVALSSQTRTMLRDARSVAMRLTRSAEVTPTEFRRSTDAMTAQLRAIGTRVR